MYMYVGTENFYIVPMNVPESIGFKSWGRGVMGVKIYYDIGNKLINLLSSEGYRLICAASYILKGKNI